MLSHRIRQVAMSATMKVSGKAKALQAEGIDVVDFSVGEPDLPTPSVVKEAGKRAIDENRTRYTANSGIVELRRAIADKLVADNGLEYAPGDILVSPGAKACIYFAAMACFDQGDEVLVPSPYWTSYPEQLRLAGARPVVVPTEEDGGFKLNPEAVESAITPRTKGIILNYPCNPTGACYGRAELEPLARICVEHGLTVVSDEIYEKLVFDGKEFTSIASLGPEIRARTVVVNGMSKAFAMTGWRVGYAAGPSEVIQAMARVQSHSTSNASSIAQWASLEGLRSAGDEVRRMKAEFERRRNAMMACLDALDGVRYVRPEGTFYVFPEVSALLGRRVGDRVLETPEDLALYLLDAARVAVVPGEAFGSPSHVRLSYAASVERIEEGMGRVASALTG